MISFTSLVQVDEGVLLECYYMLWVGGVGMGGGGRMEVKKYERLGCYQVD